MMSRSVSFGFAFLVILVIAGPASRAAEKYPSFGNIVRKDPRLDKIVPPDARMEQLADGFDWSEGPVWIKDGGYLLFSDIPRNSVMKWKEGEGVSLFMKPSGYTGVADYAPEPGSNGLNVDSQGRIIFCSYAEQLFIIFI